MPDYRPVMSDAGQRATATVTAVDETGAAHTREIAVERVLTIYLDKRELVTLMTNGGHPELLVLGYLRNQGLVEDLRQIRSVQVDWSIEAAAVTTGDGQAPAGDIERRRIVTTGCGQGSVYSDLLERILSTRLPAGALRQSALYRVLQALGAHNELYRRAGAVHGCALCAGDTVLAFVEDVGRHNAVDAIAGWMWLHGIDGGDKVFYTTGRLTSEMVLKVARMGIPVLVSRSGVTHAGVELARQVGVMLVARARGRHFQLFTGADRFEHDVPEPTLPIAAVPSR